MSENLLIGFVTLAICLAIQCVVVSMLLRILFAMERRQIIRPTFTGASYLLIAVMLIMFAGNLLQITLWAGLFFFCSEFEDFATAFYHSVVNFSTLGYGDLVMSKGRRLLGALEAANGVLMFGLTTSFLFLVLSELATRGWDQRIDQDAKSKGSPPH